MSGVPHPDPAPESAPVASAAEVARAAGILRAGGVVAFPTETVYGLGADASNVAAVQRVFTIKGRPAHHPLIVHLASDAWLDDWAREVPDAARELARAFWPGPLTLVLARRPWVLDAVTGGQDSVALRVPAHPVALALLRAAGALVAPSANRFGRVSPTTAEHVRAELNGAVDMILDGGPCQVGVESTILSLLTDTPTVLRPGAVTPEAIEAVLERPVARQGGGVRVPGSLPAHYAPVTPLELCPAADLAGRAQALSALRLRRVAVLTLGEAKLPLPSGLHVHALPADPAACARRLYATLRSLDAAGFDVLLVEEPPQGCAWDAVRDRLSRAARAFALPAGDCAARQVSSMRIDAFDYDLPEALIARHPLPQRGASRLLHVDAVTGTLTDHVFADLPRLMRPGDLVVFNDSRVIKARLRGEKASGGRVEVLVERIMGEHEAWVHLRASKQPRVGSLLRLAGEIQAEVVGREGELYRLRFDPARSVSAWLEAHGEVPLPPYIDRPPVDADVERYQTVYAREPGSVAAPTAGLHFDEAMLERLEDAGVETAYVTLHVGAGTFQPVRVEDISAHRMHSERYVVPEATVQAVQASRERGGRVLAVGTTSLRTLEAAAVGGELAAGSGETDLFITPGYRFRVVDRLLTNFHLPRSTLLMLVHAFGGTELMRRAYAHAVQAAYRFYSYGDAMLIEREPQA